MRNKESSHRPIRTPHTKKKWRNTAILLVIGVFASIMSSCVDPNAPLPGPIKGEYADIGHFTGQKYLWVPKGATGDVVTLGGFSDSQALAELGTENQTTPFPGRRYESDPSPLPGSSFMISDANASELKTDDGLYDVTTYPYDVVLLPLPPVLLSLELEAGATDNMPDSMSDAEDVFEKYRLAALKLEQRAETSKRHLEVVFFVPGITVSPDNPLWSEYSPRSAEILTSLSDRMSQPLSEESGLGGLSRSSQYFQSIVSRTWADRVSSEFIAGGAAGVEHLYADADRSNSWPIWIHVGRDGTAPYYDIVQGAINDAILRVKAAHNQ